MARDCNNSDKSCLCNFATSSGNPIAGTGSEDDPFIFPICDNPLFVIEDCDGNQQAINCGDVLRVYPSGFDGGPLVEAPTVENGILYIPRPQTRCLDINRQETTYGPFDGITQQSRPGLLEDLTIDFKGDISGMIYGQFTVCQELPAPDVVSGECFTIRTSAFSGASPPGDTTPPPLISYTDFIWEPPTDNQSPGCRTFTYFDEFQATAGSNSFALDLAVGVTPDCPHDPTRALIIKDPKMCIYY